MMVTTVEEMRAIEAAAVERQGVTVKELMSRAGRAVADLVVELLPEPGKVAFFCGKGNNGGDGFVAAGRLAAAGYKIKLVLTADSAELTGLAAEAFAELPRESVEITLFSPQMSLRADIIVDALLGFGLRGAVRSPQKEAIDFINNLKDSSKATVAAVDVPSGINSNTGRPAGAAVRADYTVTFTCPKVGLVLYPGAAYSGRLRVADIGVSRRLVREFATAGLVSRGVVKSLLPHRSWDTNKHRCGRLLVIAGSTGMTGAAALTAAAAMRAGAGLVTLAVPAGLNTIMEMKLTEVMTLPLPETKEHTLSAAAVEVILNLQQKFDAVVLGPGLSRHLETREFVRGLVPKVERPLLVDADGLNNLAGTDILKQRQAPIVVTPHSGELSRLIGVASAQIDADRIAAVRRAGEQLQSTVVLKGARTLIYGHQAIMINTSGNPGLATAGSGDVLSGVIGALMAQGLADYPAATAGVYLHGLAADLAAREMSEPALIASDLINYLPSAIKKIKSFSEKI